MLLWKELCVLLALLLLIPKVWASNSGLTRLIERVFDLNDSKTVLYIGSDDEFFNGFSKDHPSIPVIYMTNLTGNITTFGEVVLVLEFQNYEVQNELLTFIESFKTRKYVIVCAEDFITMKRWFNLLNEKKFKRIFGTTPDDGSHFYSPYSSEKQIHQLSQDFVLPKIFKFFNGFTVRSNFMFNFPMTFVYPDKAGKDQIGGFGGHIFMNFLWKHNAIYEKFPMENLTQFHVWEILTAVSEHKIDMTTNVFTMIQPMNVHKILDTVDYSYYSGKLDKFRIMVAINGYVEPNQYFLRPFDGVVWICIGITLIYITALDIIWKLCTHLEVDIWKSFSQIFLNILNVSFERPTSTAYRLHAQVSLFAFIIGNIYIIYFTSYLTAYIPIKQYDSYKDFMNNNISLLIVQTKWAWIKQVRVVYSEGLDDVIQPVSYETLYANILPMQNKSMAYILNMDEAELFLDFHSRFQEPRFRIAQEPVFPDYFLVFILPRHSPLKEVLDHFILQIMETGLVRKWKTDWVAQVLAAGYGKYVKRNTVAKELLEPLNVGHFVFVWRLLGVGLALATAVFCGEHLWYYFSNR